MARTEPNEDDAPIRPKKPFPVWGWLLVAGVSLVTVCGGIGTVGALVLRIAGRNADEAERVRQSDPKAKIWTEDELAAKVVGMDTNQVKALLGNPDHTMGDPNVTSGLPSFHYRDRLRDQHTGKTKGVNVLFRDKRATGISS